LTGNSLASVDEALAALEQGPPPSTAIGKLEGLWANDFR
jgi:hypothetical protein